MHALLQAVRTVDNRHCAECDTQIGDISSAFAVIDYGIWVCNECANSFMESELLSNSENMKTCAEDWSVEEIDRMLKFSSNKAVNAIYERHIPSNWRKITTQSTRMERINWILAKYKGKLFVFPQKSELPRSPVMSKDSLTRPSMDFRPESTELPLRLLDFFVVVSIGDEVPAPEEEGEGGQTHPLQVEEVEFIPTVSSCFPEPESLPDTPLPDHLGMFIFPNGATLSSMEVPPTFFTFVLTDTNGVKLYGGVLHVYELVDPAELSGMLHGVPVTSKYVYVPKALVVLSHYPFFHLFYNVLKQLYRISLSSCPLAMENYVAHIVQEAPLPPPGCTRVAIPIADSLLMVSRPPRNQLPMTDFSYRPLFTSLSVSNILTVFSFICAEHKVCFASKYLSILTPVQESFLSFLFPLVWQGAYIPVMPATMLDLLDAPVPMLLGVERCQLFEGKSLKPFFGGGVVVVDLDCDEVLVGCDDYGKALEPMHMHAKDLSKLKDKLIEFGGCVYEAQGTRTKMEEALKAFPDNEHLQPIQCFASLEDGLKVPIMKEEPDEGVSVQSSHFFISSEASCAPPPLLSPASNMGDEDAFNAKEIRRAFLRFFVSSLRDMHSDNIRNDLSSAKQAVSDTSDKSDKRKSASKKKKKDAPELTKFMTELLNTQMLTFFSEERIYHPDHAEVRFFDESILDKLNRSVTTVNKMTTPFLDDKSEHTHELYLCLPSRADKGDKQQHLYPRFPHLSRTAQFPRKAKVLQREAEHGRKLDTKNQLHAVDLATATNEKNPRRSSFSFARKESVMDLVFSEGAEKFKAAIASLLLIQACWRKELIRKQSMKLLSASILTLDETRRFDASCIFIQKHVRGYLIRNILLKWKAAVRLQARVREFVSRGRFQRLRMGVIKLQARSRMRKVRRAYGVVLSTVSIKQARLRGERVRSDIAHKRSIIVESLRRVIFQLWTLSNTPLEYRSQFWSFLDTHSFFHLSLHVAEVRSLWAVLGYDASPLLCLQYPAVLTSIDKLEQYVQGKRGKGKISESLAIISERKKLYSLMKSGVKNLADQRKYFDLFGISSQKKRKHTLSGTLLWGEADLADPSAVTVLDLLDLSSPRLREEWVRRRDAARPEAYSMVGVLQAVMRLQQRRALLHAQQIM